MQIPDDLTNRGKKLLNFIEFDENEQILREVHKHYFGQLFIYIFGGITAVLTLLAVGIGTYFMKGDIFATGTDVSSYRPISVIFGIIIVAIIVAGTLLSAYIYRSNSMLVTSDKVVQVIYRNLFDRKISQLYVADIQDVTVKQTGVLARIFNYGTIVIETAGEQMNYVFTFAPDPYECAKSIISAHERNVVKYGN